MGRYIRFSIESPGARASLFHGHSAFATWRAEKTLMEPDQDISALRDFREIATLPVAAGLAALAATWVVWYFTGNSCSDELAASTGCNASFAAVFINPAMLKDIVTNSAIAATGGGIWSYIMITRERRAREAAEQALARERERAEEERRRADAERDRLLAEIERLTRRLNGHDSPNAESAT